MNAKIGKNVVLQNNDVRIASTPSLLKCMYLSSCIFVTFFVELLLQGVQEAERPNEGFYIRSGLIVILKNATISDGTII